MIVRFNRVLAPVLIGALVAVGVAPSLAHADAASDYRTAVLADNPVSYWRLNDSSSSTAVDQQGLNPGQISGATLSEPGPMVGDASMRFNGGGIVDLGHDASLRPSGSWTVETWFRASASDAAACAPNFSPNCSLYSYHAFGFNLQLGSDGRLNAGVDPSSGTSVGVATSVSYADDRWHYVAVVWSTSGLALFVDGAEVADTANTSSTTYTCCEDVAGIANDGACDCAPLTGWESEVAFYNYALPATRIQAHYAAAGVATNGLVGEWQGNGNPNDSVGTNNGTLIDGGYAVGQNGEAFQLDGNNDYVAIPSTAMQTVVGPISVAANIYPERISPGEEVFSQYDTHNTATTFSLSVQAGGTLQWEVVGHGCDSLRGGARTIETTSPVLTLDTWTHVAATFEPSTQTLQILVNGSPVSTKLTDDATVSSLCVSSTPLRIGAAEQFYGGLAGFYQGKIQDVKLYNADINGGTGSGGGGGFGGGSGGSPGGGSRYVAMGDSYSSGEGTASYDTGTDTSNDKCHRSSEDIFKASYPRLLQLLTSAVPTNLTFVACSGATINDVLNGRDGEPPQVNALGNDVSLVTISVGGDDLGFPKVLENCVDVPIVHPNSDAHCQGQQSEIRDRLFGNRARGISAVTTRLVDLYRTINRRAPNARIIVIGYPHLFPLQGNESCGFPVRYLDSSDIRWLNGEAREADLFISAAVNASGVAEYVDTFNAMTDSSGAEHNACPHLFVAPWINELQALHPFDWPYTAESFHPNPAGYLALAEALLGAINRPRSGTTSIIKQGQTIAQSFTVAPGAGQFTVSVRWPGSTVTTSLVSPKGRVIDAQTVSKTHNVQHELGPTYEVYSIARPERGRWQVRTVGVSVAPAGEPVRIELLSEIKRHIPPIARATARPTRGRTPLRVGFASSGSRAIEARITAYRWSFGDGGHGTGRSPHHTYKHAGRYAALLDIVESTGASTLASVTVVVRR